MFSPTECLGVILTWGGWHSFTHSLNRFVQGTPLSARTMQTTPSKPTKGERAMKGRWSDGHSRSVAHEMGLEMLMLSASTRTCAGKSRKLAADLRLTELSLHMDSMYRVLACKPMTRWNTFVEEHCVFPHKLCPSPLVFGCLAQAVSQLPINRGLEVFGSG